MVDTLSGSGRLGGALLRFSGHALLCVCAGVTFGHAISTRTNTHAPGPHTVSYDDLLGIVDLGVSAYVDAPPIAVSPDQQAVAIQERRATLTSNSTTIGWLIVRADGTGQVIDAGDGGELILDESYGLPLGFASPQMPEWSPDSSWIVYRARHNGHTQLWRSWRGRAGQEQLTHTAADVEAYLLSGDGTKIVFVTGQSAASSEGTAEARRGFLYDSRFAPVLGDTGPVHPSYGDDHFRVDTWVHELAGSVERRATPEEVQEFASRLRSKSSSESERDRTRRAKNSLNGVALVNLRKESIGAIDPILTVVGYRGANRQPLICKSMACTGRFKGLWISDDGRSAYFLRPVLTTDSGPMSLYKWTLGTREPIELLRTPGYLENCAFTTKRLLCGFESATQPAKLVGIDLVTGAVRTLYDPNPGFPHLKFGEVTALSWRDAAGAEGFGHLIKPVGYTSGTRYPLVIVQYRSVGFLRGGVGDEVPIQILASLGFAVLSFDRPMDPELKARVRTPDELNAALWKDLAYRRRMFSVLMAGIDTLEGMGIVDDRRIGISGLSDGANSTTFSLIHAPTRFAAASVGWTYWSPLLFYLAGPKFQPVLESWGLGAPGDAAADRQWREISIGLNADTINVPLLVQVADSELLTETENYSNLKRLGRPVEMHVFPDEYHIKVQPLHRLNVYRRNVQWFQFWLQGIEDPDPVDSAQYERWRAMRALCGCPRFDMSAARQNIAHHRAVD